MTRCGREPAPQTAQARTGLRGTMKPRTHLRVSSFARLSLLNQSPRESHSNELSSSPGASASRWILGAALGVFVLGFLAANVNAQQAYPSSPYGAYGAPGSGSPYPPQYAQPAPQYGYPQQQPQQPPQYGYGQPQYAPQQPYGEQPYADQQPYGAPASPYSQPDQGQPPAPVQSLNAQDLEQLIAPIALYPDNLLAQILAASTYPAEVAVADQWLQQMRTSGSGSPDQIADGANAQTGWDPSIKALTAFPDVLDMLNQNLEWTTDLGNAYYNQPQDVMQTVQVLRDRAEQAGNLQPTPQERVDNNQGNIELAPTDPQEVYVPTYNPWDVYGQPIPPYSGFSLQGALGNSFGGDAIQYGLGFALSAFDRMPFGWPSWGLDWLGQSVLFDQSGYYTQSNTVADWGLPRGGPRAYSGYGRGGSDRRHDGQRGSYGFNGSRQGFDGRGNFQRGGWSNNRGPGQSYVRPAERFPEPGRLGYSNRMSQEPGYGYTRPQMPARQAYGGSPQPYSRPAPQQSYGYRAQTDPGRREMYANPGYSNRPQTFNTEPGYRYGYGNNNRSASPYAGQPFATRPGFAYANPRSNPSAPRSGSSGFFAPRSSGGFGNSGDRSGHSGGFHLFGHNSEPSGFSGGHAPKSSFGGGHQSRGFGGFGGGHSPKGPGGFGGGGHSSHSFGGGGGHGSSPKSSHSGGGGGGHHHF